MLGEVEKAVQVVAKTANVTPTHHESVNVVIAEIRMTVTAGGSHCDHHKTHHNRRCGAILTAVFSAQTIMWVMLRANTPFVQLAA